METINEMVKRHDKEIATLQRECSHPKEYLSEWMDYMWAPGHILGQVRICNLCGKEMETG